MTHNRIVELGEPTACRTNAQSKLRLLIGADVRIKHTNLL